MADSSGKTSFRKVFWPGPEKAPKEKPKDRPTEFVKRKNYAR